MTNTHNVSMKKGFTMIELIFVIVIIGILAAVAIPRLAATRDDAKIATSISNLKVLINDSKAYYTAQGKDKWAAALWKNVTDVVDANSSSSAAKSTTIHIKGDQQNCFKIEPSITGLAISSENINDAICSKAIALGKKAGVLDSSGDANVTLGGQSVVF